LVDLLEKKSEVFILTALSRLLKSLTMLTSFLIDVIFGLSVIPSIFVKIACNAITLIDTDGDKDTSCNPTPTIPNSAQFL